ncbi:MAG: hypothetical protein QM820_52230 [Minicystis sp.]
MLSGLMASVEVTSGGFEISAGRVARAGTCDPVTGMQTCADKAGPLLDCLCTDQCTPVCPKPGDDFFRSWEKALLFEMELLEDSSLVNYGKWDQFFDEAWQNTKDRYPGSWAAVSDPQNEPLLVDTLRADVDVRQTMTQIFRISNAVATNASTAAQLDEKFDETCSPSAPAGYGDLVDPPPPPGYWRVPNNMTLGAFTAHELSSGLPLGYSVNTYGYGMGRLKDSLRLAAREANAFNDLARAAAHYRVCDNANGNAYADLAVTGQRSFAHFASAAVTGDPNLRARLFTKMADYAMSMPENCTPPPGELPVSMALDRAYRVANVIRAGFRPGSKEAAYRDTFGWIAVSGEDDQPYLPVNVPSAPFPQYRTVVTVPAPQGAGPIDVSTRYFIAETGAPEPHLFGSDPKELPWSVPSEATPTLSDDAEVILFIHGMDSRAEESLDLVDALHARAQLTPGRNITVIAMDLPSSGYATKVNPFDVSSIEAVGTGTWFLPPFGPRERFFFAGAMPDFDARGVHNVPVVDFDEEFIVKFVDTLDAQLGGRLKPRIKALAGGSLGGSMGLRLGRRPGVDWLPKIVSWSPASVWNGFADGDIVANADKHLTVKVAWHKAKGDSNIFTDDNTTAHTIDNAGDFYGNPRNEDPDARWDFFVDAFHSNGGFFPTLAGLPAQPFMWHRQDWPCLHATIAGAHLDRQETYHPLFRWWHWRLAVEQLIYSHKSDPATGGHPYEDNVIPTMLLTGAADNWAYIKIFENTKEIAGNMKGTPGRAVILGTASTPAATGDVPNTGHSMADERPKYLAAKIVSFLKHDYVFDPIPIPPPPMHLSACGAWGDAHGGDHQNPDPDCGTSVTACSQLYCKELCGSPSNCTRMVYSGSGCDCDP